MSKRGRGGKGAAVRARGRGRTKSHQPDLDALNDDDDDMNLAAMVRATAGGGHDSLDESLSTSDDLLGGLGGVDFTGSMDADPYSSFGSIGALGADPLGNMHMPSDPFGDLADGTLTPVTDMSGTLLPPPAAVESVSATVKPKKNRKSKSKADAANGGTASPAPFTPGAGGGGTGRLAYPPPLALIPFSFSSSAVAPLFHRMCAAGSGGVGSSSHLASLTKSVGAMSSDEIAALAREIAAMGREARGRASRMESELRKMGPDAEAWANSHPTPPTHDIDEMALHAELSALLASASEYDDGAHSQMAGKRKRAGGQDMHAAEEAFEPTPPPPKPAPKPTASSTSQPHKKKKTLSGPGGVGSGAFAASVASAAGGGKKGSSFDSDADEPDDDDEYNSDVDSAKPTKKKKGAMTEKEKQRQIAAFWTEVDDHFAFPIASQIGVMKPRPEGDFYDAYHGPGSSTSFGGKLPNSSDPAFKIPPAGEHYRDVAERLKEEEKERQAKEKAASEAPDGSTAPSTPLTVPIAGPPSIVDDDKDPKKKKSAAASLASAAASKKKSKKNLSSALVAMGLDDAKSKKSMLETDKLLGGDKTFHQSTGQTLSMRLLSMLIEQPHGAPRSGPWFPHPSGKDKKPAAATSTTHRKKPAEYTIDKRIEMEFKYLGLLGGTPEYSYTRELADRADDELCAVLRSHQKELSTTLESMNVSRTKVYPTVSRLTDNGVKMSQLLDAESLLHKTYAQRVQGVGTGKKKTLSSLHTNFNLGMNDPAIERAIDAWNNTISQTGTRRAITGFIPDPVDLGGIPRFRLNEYPPVRSYADVYENGLEVPISTDENGRPNFKHFVHPQHPHNPNYENPPPPPPPPAPVHNNHHEHADHYDSHNAYQMNNIGQNGRHHPPHHAPHSYAPHGAPSKSSPAGGGGGQRRANNSSHSSHAHPGGHPPQPHGHISGGHHASYPPSTPSSSYPQSYPSQPSYPPPASPYQQSQPQYQHGGGPPTNKYAQNNGVQQHHQQGNFNYPNQPNGAYANNSYSNPTGNYPPPANPSGNYGYSNPPLPPNQYRGSSGVGPPPPSSRASSGVPNLPPSFAGSFQAPIGNLPGLGMMGGAGGAGSGAGAFGVDLGNMNLGLNLGLGDFTPPGLITPNSPNRRSSASPATGLNSSLTIGQLPPADTGLGQFGSMSTPQDFFSM